jgi:hypothetical protein
MGISVIALLTNENMNVLHNTVSIGGGISSSRDRVAAKVKLSAFKWKKKTSTNVYMIK